MNTDPLLVGVGTVFPNQNSSTAPTIWEEDTEQAAQQGIPCGSGPMLTLTKRSTDQQLLPGGAVNPCPETAPFCLDIENIQVNAGVSQRLSASLIAAGLVGGEFIGGRAGAPGLGVVGVGAPGDGVRGIASGATPSGHGVAGFTFSSSVGHAGVLGEAGRGGIGVLGQCQRGSGIGVRGLGSNQAVRGDGGSFGVVGRGTATGVDGRGAGAGTFGVVGVGGVAGVWGGNSASGGIGVVGVPGPFNGTVFPWAGRFDGSVQVNGALFVNGNLFVSGTKAAVVPHPDGSQRATYAVETPESWFEDVGRAQLRQGVARVDVDRDFAAVSGLGDDYHVFVTPEGPSNGLYVTDRTASGFDVLEQGEGTGEISFSYRIMTRRPDVRSGRLEPIEASTPEGEKTGTALPDLPPSPCPDLPGELAVGPEGVPPAEPQPEEAATPQQPPSDWPETVPWPPDIMMDGDTR
jgi:hypothetical protein